MDAAMFGLRLTSGAVVGVWLIEFSDVVVSCFTLSCPIYFNGKLTHTVGLGNFSFGNNESP